MVIRSCIQKQTLHNFIFNSGILVSAQLKYMIEIFRHFSYLRLQFITAGVLLQNYRIM